MSSSSRASLGALALSLSLAACTTGAVPDAGASADAARAATPGVFGARTGDVLRVQVLAEENGRPIDGARVLVGGTAMLTDARGDAVVPASGAVTLVVSAQGRVTEQWIGVLGGLAVVPLAPSQSPAQTEVRVEIEGDEAWGTAHVPVRARRGLGAMKPDAHCVAAAGRGRCELVLSIPSGATTVTIVRARAEVREFATVSLDALREPIPFAAGRAVDVAVDPLGTTFEVVGVPGFVHTSGIAFLPASPGASGALSVPPQSAGPFWATRRAIESGGATRLFVLRFGLVDAAPLALGAFPAAPTAQRTPTGLRVETTARTVAVELRDAAGETVAHVLALDVDGVVALDTPTFARAIVRSLDVTASGSEFALDALDRPRRLAELDVQ